MSKQMIFWILMILWLAGSISGNRLGVWAPRATNLLLFAALLILGWATFGAPVQ